MIYFQAILNIPLLENPDKQLSDGHPKAAQQLLVTQDFIGSVAGELTASSAFKKNDLLVYLLPI